MASKGWKVVQAHVPMIRFRKGGNSKVAPAVVATATSRSEPSSGKPSGATGPNVVVLPIINDFQLPLRFHRRPIDQKEIDFINRGGPD